MCLMHNNYNKYYIKADYFSDALIPITKIRFQYRLYNALGQLI